MNYLKTFLPYLFGNKKGKSLDIPLPDPVPWSSLRFEERLMFLALKDQLDSYLKGIDLNHLENKQDIFHLFNFLDYVNSHDRQTITSRYSSEFSLYIKALEARALYAYELQNLLDLKNDRTTLFVILKKDRRIPGRLILKNKNNQFLTNKDSSLWSIPILGLSGRDLSFHHSNGQTPMGVYYIDGVMPEANNKIEFGEHRRLIINFIKNSPEEAELAQFLPKTHHELDWWKQSVLARSLGRSLLRIHGSGRVNRNPFNAFYPFVPTSGCLATNEGRSLWGKKACDQRLLLDQLLLAQGLERSFENESKIQGLLYVVEFSDNLSTLRF